jgi:hypothetical protein
MKIKEDPRKESRLTEVNKGYGGRDHRPQRILSHGVPGGNSFCILICCLRYLLFNPLRPAVLALATVGLSSPVTSQAQVAIEAWVQRYDGSGNAQSQPVGLAVDGTGNLYVACSWWSSDVSLQYGWATLKYSGAGTPLWTNLYYGIYDYGLQGLGTNPHAIAVDANGNVYVTGYSQEPNHLYCTTLKYSSAGTPLWTNVYPTSGSSGSALAVDGSGNVIVVGTVAGLSDDYLMIKYSSAGALLWARQYNGPANGNDHASAVALDSSDKVFVTGDSAGSGTYADYATVAYSSAGALLWTQRYNNAPRNGGDIAYAVAVDLSGSVVVTGASEGLDSMRDFVTIKYSGAGVPLWTNRYNRLVNGADQAYAVAVDASANVFVTGYVEGVGGDPCDYGTIKYSNAGVPLWTNLYDGPGQSWDEAKALALDVRGNVYVTGLSASTDTFPNNFDYATVAYSSAGVPLWTNRYNGPLNDDDGARAIALDDSGNVFVTGYIAGTGTWADVATIKYVVPVIVARQPLSCTNAVGTTASFTVEAAGSLPLSYQWRRQGTNLVDRGNVSGVTTTNLLIANVQLADAAGYSVVITNAYGSTTSSVAQLTVINPGRFTDLSYSKATGFSCIFREGTHGQTYRIQRSPALAEGSWTNWQTFTYTEPVGLMDVGATGVERRYYRALSP